MGGREIRLRRSQGREHMETLPGCQVRVKRLNPRKAGSKGAAGRILGGMETTPLLYSPLRLRGLELANRLILSPMCQYSAVDGLVQPWHRRHYVERAIGGVGLVLVEATAVQPQGRISPQDLGLWNESQTEAFRPLVQAVHEAGAKIGVQLAHAGRKASVYGRGPQTGAVPVAEGGWTPVSSGTDPFNPTYAVPEALSASDIEHVVADFASAAQRAVAAGFDTVEIHSAHGYLLHQFLSPLTNKRTDAWGDSRENRCRLALEVTRAIRKVLPPTMPLLLRLSATDWVEGGWNVEDSIALLHVLKAEGVDFADISSGGVIPGVKIPLAPGYQVPLAAQVRQATGLPTGTVGLITDAAQAEAILSAGDADAVLMGRQLLRDPYYPLRHAPAEHRLVPWQYQRAF